MSDLIELQSILEDAEIWLLAVLAITELVIDLAWRNRRNYRDSAVNIAIAIVYSIVNATIGYAVAFSGLTFFSQLSWMQIPTNGWTILLAAMVADVIYYWEHRTEHRIRFFWAYHNVHHSSTDYNLTVASRLSWVEACFLWIFYIPMALIGFDPLLIIISVSMNAAYQTWIHTQKIDRLGILDRIVNTPSLHRVHHASNSNYIDKNFGGILMIWDRLFGTYQPEEETPVYGLTKNIKTNNPLKINAIGYQQICKNIFKSKSVKDLWQSIFGSLSSKPKQYFTVDKNIQTTDRT